MTFGEQNTLQDGCDQLDVAFKEYGVNFLDTAELYSVPTRAETQGATDRIIAKWLKGQDRSKVILASKVSGDACSLTVSSSNPESNPNPNLTPTLLIRQCCGNQIHAWT